jgi:hypothetical protein
LTHKKKKKARKEFFLDMMNDTPMTSLMQDLSEVNEIVTRDENWMALHEQNTEAKKSRYIHGSMVDNTGAIIQFINSQPAHFCQTPGAGEVFGGIRISLIDPEKIPNYVDKYKGSIRAHARVQLEEHLIRANHPGGFNETLTDEDFGITMAWGSLSPTGRKMSPSPRGEGPIWYGIFPTLIEPVNMTRDPSNPGNWDHVINCYVSLINKQGRRSYLRQHPEAKIEKENRNVKRQGQSPPYEDERGYVGREGYAGRGGYVGRGGYTGRGGYSARGGYQGYQKRPREDEKEEKIEIAEIALDRWNTKMLPD